MYLLYFLVAVVLTLVILTMVLFKDTTIQVLYQKTVEDDNEIATKFPATGGETENPNRFILEDLILSKGDELIIGTSSAGGNYSMKITLVNQSTPTEDIASITLTQSLQVTRLTAPSSGNDFALKYNNGATGILEFVHLSTTKGLF